MGGGVSTAYTMKDLLSALRWMEQEGLVEKAIDPATGEDVWRIAPGAENFKFSE